MLKCTRCKTEKPSTLEFFPPHNKKKNGFDSWCRSCRGNYRAEIRRGNYRFAISDDNLKSLIKSSESCTICGDVCNLVVDHDHKAGSIRGMLCNRCNKGLGLFRDSPELLEYARIYILASMDDLEAEAYVQRHSGLSLYGELN
jgi:hypothetical protein